MTTSRRNPTVRAASSGTPHPDPTSAWFRYLPTVLRRAAKLRMRDDFGPAERLLGQALAGINPTTAPADPWLLQAVLRYRLDPPAWTPLISREDAALLWAGYPLWAATRLYRPAGYWWHEAASHYARALDDHQLSRAAAIFQLQGHAYRRHRHTPDVHLNWRLLAIALYKSGRCRAAHHEIRDALQAWRRYPDTDTETGVKLLWTYLRILAGCAQTDQARAAYLAHADLLGPPDSPTRTPWTTVAVLIAVRAEQEAAEEHTHCELRTPATAPDPTAATDRVAYWRNLFRIETSQPNHKRQP